MDIDELKSFQAIKNIIPGYTLQDFQSADIVKILFNRRGILAYETGLGKTIVSSAIMKLIKNRFSHAKFIWFVTKSQLAQTPDKIREYTGFNIITSTGEKASIDNNLTADKIIEADCVILTHACLTNPRVLYRLLQFRNYMFGLFVDEAHNVSNLQGNNSAMSLFHIASFIPFVVALTATPILTEASQLANLMKITSESTVPSSKQTTAVLEHEGLIYHKYLVHVRRRKDLGLQGFYKACPEIVDPLPHQVNAEGADMFVRTKGDGAIPQFQRLLEICKRHPNKRGLVYIHRREIVKFVESELNKTDIKFAVLTGDTTLKERKEICESFNNNELQLVVTSVTEALDLDSTFIIFYEFTVYMEQMIGRGYRGLDSRTLYIYFIFTRNTGEFEYFLRNIYARSVLISNILGADIKHIIDLAFKASMELT